MVIQLNINGDLEKMILDHRDKKYSHLNKKAFIIEMVRKQVEQEKKNEQI